MKRGIAAVMVHVGNVEQGLSWYEKAFPSAVRSLAPGTEFVFLRVGNVQLELVCSDEKVSSGAAGSVVYWHIAELSEAMRHFCMLGATVYRGPMQIEGGLGMCQVKDPWGNCIGLRGPYRPPATAYHLPPEQQKSRRCCFGLTAVPGRHNQ